MPRAPRTDVGNMVYHCINRANARVQIFDSDKDYQQFEKVLMEAKERTDMRILSYTVMPNHFHLVLYPRQDGDLSKFMNWLTMTHTQRWHVIHDSVGEGHLYQGRYKSFLVQTDQYFLELVLYVEQNSLKAKLVRKAEDWRWGSLWRREHGTRQQKELLASWPVEMSDGYLRRVNTLISKDVTETIQNCIKRGKPFGHNMWVDETIDKFDLLSTVRLRGRPKKGS